MKRTPEDVHLAVAVALVAVARASAAAPATLLHVEVQAPATVRLELSAPVEPLARRLPAAAGLPSRIYLDLPGTTLAGPPSAIPGVGNLLRVRTGQFDRSTARVVFDVDQTARFTVRRVERTLIVELSPDQAAQPTADVAHVDAPPEAPATVEPAPPAVILVERHPSPMSPPPPAEATPPSPLAASEPTPPNETKPEAAPVPEPATAAEAAREPTPPPAAAIDPPPVPPPAPVRVVEAPPPPMVKLIPVPTPVASVREPPPSAVVEAPTAPAPEPPPLEVAEAPTAPEPPLPDIAEAPTPGAPEPSRLDVAEAPPAAEPEPPALDVAEAPPPPEPEPPVVAEAPAPAAPEPPSPAADEPPTPAAPTVAEAPVPAEPEPPPAIAEKPPPADEVPPVASTAIPWTGLPVVVLDAGHGGRDPGAEGVGGVVEKDVVLGLARMLAERLPARIPVAVVMTRADDSFVSIDRRLSAAPDGAVFLSLHANACSDPSARGLEVFYGGGAVRQASTDGTSSPAAILGWCIREALGARVGPVRGGPRQGDFRILTQNPVPSALVEIGYLTHPAEAERARDASYQGVLADALIEGIAAFLRASAPPPL